MSNPNDDKHINQKIIVGNNGRLWGAIQIIVRLIINPWAFIAGAVILSVMFNMDSLRSLIPTPMAFEPATTDESLIIVADFDDRSGGKYSGIDPAQYVYEQLVAQAQKQAEEDKLKTISILPTNIRIERLRQVVDDNNAKSVGRTYNATLIVWGWYDAITITPRITRIKKLQGESSREEGHRLSLVDPDNIEFSVVTDLPSQVNYLVMFTLAVDRFSHFAPIIYKKENGSVIVAQEILIVGGDNGALSNFNNVIKSIPPNATINPSEAYFYRGYIYHLQKDYDQAIIDYDKAIQLKPDYIDAYANRADAYISKDEYDRAIADYNVIGQLKPDYADLYYFRGSAYAHIGDYDHAIADYSKTIQLKPEETSTDSNSLTAFFQCSCYSVVDIYYNRGLAYHNKGDYDRAIADYDKVIELESQYAYAYINRGLAYHNKGDYDRAIANYDKAIELKSDCVCIVGAYNNRGLSYIQKGEYDKALADYDEAIKLSPDFAEAYFNRGVAYGIQDKYAEAINDYTTAIGIDPQYEIAYVNRGNAYADQQIFDQAIINYQAAINLDKNDSYAYCVLGITYTKINDYASAISMLEKAVQLDRKGELPWCQTALENARQGIPTP